MELTYTECANDAGLLREYLARHYGAAFCYGASGAVWGRGWTIAARLARMINWPVSWVIRQAQSDYRDIEE